MIDSVHITRAKDQPPCRSRAVDKPQPSAYIAAPRYGAPLAQVAELVDALVSGTSGAIRGGSSPLLGTIVTSDKSLLIKHLAVTRQSGRLPGTRFARPNALLAIHSDVVQRS